MFGIYDFPEFPNLRIDTITNGGHFFHQFVNDFVSTKRRRILALASYGWLHWEDFFNLFDDL